MNALCVAVFVAVVAAASASGIGLGWGLAGGVDSAAVLAGPSGTVIRSGVAVGAPAIAPLGLGWGLGLGLGHAGLLAIPPGSGLEGQWIPDINEKLHDDGSYKPHVYGW